MGIQIHIFWKTSHDYKFNGVLKKRNLIFFINSVFKKLTSFRFVILIIIRD